MRTLLRRSRLSAILFAVIGVLIAACATRVAFGRQKQQAQQPIQVRVSLVNISFIAKNAHGDLVDNLTKDDIELYEDGQQQSLRYFARAGDVPLTLGLILDVSGSQESFGKNHKNDIGIFLKDVLGEKDRAFLVCFGNHLRLISDFNPSGEDLLNSFEEYEKKKDKEMKKYAELAPDNTRDAGTAFYDSIFYSVDEKLSKENGRRALLIFSDGEDNSSSHDEMTTVEAAQAEDVSVYTIRYTEEHHGKLTARNQYGIRVMDRIAKETGALTVDARQTDPHVYFKQIGDELRNVYEVGYYPTNVERDGTFHKILIKTKQPGVTIRAKTGYFAK